MIETSKIPTETTEPCRLFLLEHNQLLHFVGFVVGMAQRADEFSRRAAKWLLKCNEMLPSSSTDPEKDKEKNRRVAEEGSGILEEFDQFVPLAQQVVLWRAVDNFLTYNAQILALVFRTHPATLKSKETERLDQILQYTSMNELIAALADKRVNELSYKGIHDLERYLSEKIGFDLFSDEETRGNIWFLVEARNLVVHNRGIVNTLFRIGCENQNSHWGSWELGFLWGAALSMMALIYC